MISSSVNAPRVGAAAVMYSAAILSDAPPPPGSKGLKLKYSNIQKRLNNKVTKILFTDGVRAAFSVIGFYCIFVGTKLKNL